MMYTKGTFYEALKEIVDGCIEKLQEAHADLNAMEAKIRSGNYSSQYLDGTVYPKIRELKAQIEGYNSECMSEVNELCEAYRKELEDEDCLDGSKLTPDINLLNSGVKLHERDLEAMLRRNEGNKTMTQLILRYADSHKLRLEHPGYAGNTDTINVLKSIPYAVKVTTKWYGDQSVYNNLMGEGSTVQRALSDD